MKLDAKALRYMSSEDFRVLTAVTINRKLMCCTIKRNCCRLKWVQKITKWCLLPSLLKLLN